MVDPQNKIRVPLAGGCSSQLVPQSRSVARVAGLPFHTRIGRMRIQGSQSSFHSAPRTSKAGKAGKSAQSISQPFIAQC